MGVSKGNIKSFLWRTFFLQSSRNMRILDGIGFFHAILPLLRDVDRKQEGPVDMSKHLGYFNCNPLLAPFVITHIAEMEKRRLAGDSSITDAMISRYKDVLSSSLTAIGDYFTEMILLPLALTIGCIFATYNSYFGLVLFLAIYNFYHLRLRIKSSNFHLDQFRASGREVLFGIVGEERLIENIAGFAFGVFAGVVAVKAFKYGGGSFTFIGALISFCVVLLRKKLSFTTTIILMFFLISILLVGFLSRA